MANETNGKMYVVLVVLAIAVALMAAVIYAGSVSSSDKDGEHTISISGSAEKKMTPDTASLSIGVVVRSPTANEASVQNAALMNAVITELKKMGLEDKEIRTSYVSIDPVYDYTSTPTIVAYSASNTVQVTTKMLENVSAMIDRSTAAGANQIGGVTFSVSDEQQATLRSELFQAAVADAKSKADELASGLGLEIVGVQTASVSDVASVQPIYREAPVAEAAGSTPIQPGETTVSLSVQVTYIVK
ncbi:SIMPL domain-containing protein [uncultured Methanomethylovorans sp.]|uniref:SIMPL domain-containing protein n=1 Tax=uncultured Methanomethylovorans sp. TaxID=183759 RepID=UPI00260B6B4F|nr:SIMPL domain-containing protein [uncultured Methanomethylovorans sp.]